MRNHHIKVQQKVTNMGPNMVVTVVGYIHKWGLIMAYEHSGNNQPYCRKTVWACTDCQMLGISNYLGISQLSMVSNYPKVPTACWEHLASRSSASRPCRERSTCRGPRVEKREVCRTNGVHMTSPLMLWSLGWQMGKSTGIPEFIHRGLHHRFP